MTDRICFEKKQIEAQAQLAVSQKLKQQAANELELELKRDQERDDARRENDRLIALQGQVQVLETARHDLDVAQGQAIQTFRDRSDSQAHRDDLQNEFGQLEQNLAQVEKVKLKLLATQQAENDAQIVYDRWIKLRDIARNWARRPAEEEH